MSCIPHLAVLSTTKERNMKEIKTIVCAVDFSEISQEVAEFTKMMAMRHEAKVHVVYIAPTLTQYVGFHVPPASIDSFVGEITTGAEKTMQQFLSENFAGCQSEGQVLSGHAADEILAYAKKTHADLVIMGTHGRKGFDRFLFGSVAERVVKGSLCPVLTIRPQDE